MYTKAQLLKAVRAAGFKGDETPEAIKAWVDAEGYELPADLDIDKCFATKAKLTLEPAIDPDDAIKPKAVKPDSANKAAAVDADIAAKGAPAVHAGGRWADTAARKRYDQRAALPIGHPQKARYSCAEAAEQATAFIRYSAMKDRDYAQKATDLEIVGKAMVTTIAEDGGNLVPEVYEAELIDNLNQYGAARQWIGAGTSSGPIIQKPRITARTTISVVGETATIAQSNPTTDMIQIVSKRYAGLTLLSMEVLNDSALSVSDMVNKAFTQAFSDIEDQQVFYGTGVQGTPYFGVVGVEGAFRQLIPTWGTNMTYAAGLVIGGSANTGASHDEIVRKNLVDVMSRVQPRNMPNAKWVMNQTLYYSKCVELAFTQGGSNAADLIGGLGNPMLLGKPVIFAEVAPRYAGATDLVNTLPIIFGDGNAAGTIRDVKGGMSIQTSDQRYFDTDQFAIKATHRKAILVHDVGNANATLSSRVSGPVAALAMHSS